MKPRKIHALAVIVAFNLGFVVISAFLAVSSTQNHPMMGELVNAHGVNLHVLDSGPPGNVDRNSPTLKVPVPTLVLLHGASTSLLDFEPSLKPRLKDAMRVVSIDRPGHGYSERGKSRVLKNLVAAESSTDQLQDHWVNPHLQARLIAQALRQLGIKESIWVGHSWAGSVVLAGLLDESLNISAGVLIAGATHPWQGSSSWYTELAVTPVLGSIFSWQYIGPIGRLVMGKTISGVFAPETVPEDYIESTGVALSTRPTTFQYNAKDRTQLSEFLETQSLRYESIDKPLLSIIGSDDKIVPGWNHSAKLAVQLPELLTLELSGAGHALHHTRANTVADRIKEFALSLN